MFRQDSKLITIIISRAEQKNNRYSICCTGFDIYECWRIPIFPGRHQPSIVGTSELNFRVRNGNGWTLTVNNTNYSYIYTKLNWEFWKPQGRLVTRRRIELLFAAWEAAVLAAWPTGHVTLRIREFGAPSGIRTRDPLIKSQLLYQLS